MVFYSSSYFHNCAKWLVSNRRSTTYQLVYRTIVVMLNLSIFTAILKLAFSVIIRLHNKRKMNFFNDSSIFFFFFTLKGKLL